MGTIARKKTPGPRSVQRGFAPLDALVETLNRGDKSRWPVAIERTANFCIGHDDEPMLTPRAFAELLPRLHHKRHARRLMTVYRDAMVARLLAAGRTRTGAQRIWDEGHVHFLRAWATGKAMREIDESLSRWESDVGIADESSESR